LAHLRKRLFEPGEHVRVTPRGRPGHVRTPHYVRGKVGVIESYLGDFPSPEELAYGQDGLPKRRLYSVKFKQDEIWQDYGAMSDFVLVDIYENWLQEIGR
jgi:nitrile hydratase